MSVEFRAVAAFAASVALAVIAVWLAVAAGRAYVIGESRVDGFVRADRVVSLLSTTTSEANGAAAGDEVTKRVRARLGEVAAERERTHREVETFARASALFGALAIGVHCLGYPGLLRMLRERRQLRARLAAEQSHDSLTGLPNRRFFAEWLSFAIAHARRERAHVGVLFIDIGGCAAVVELHGGLAAEALLVEIARRFRTAAREGDVFARLGAGEFALATPNARDARELALLAQRLRDVLNDPAQAPLADSPIGTSIGIALFPEDADDSAGVMAAANAAMYAARRAGRNHVVFNAIAA